jgi:hypothetical protein
MPKPLFEFWDEKSRNLATASGVPTTTKPAPEPTIVGLRVLYGLCHCTYPHMRQAARLSRVKVALTYGGYNPLTYAALRQLALAKNACNSLKGCGFAIR